MPLVKKDIYEFRLVDKFNLKDLVLPRGSRYRMRASNSLPRYLIILPIIGLIAFFFDSSFVALRNYLPFYRPVDVSAIYAITSIGCVIGVIGILYILFRMTDDTSKRSGRRDIMKYVFFGSQIVILAFIIVTLLQLQRDGTYSFVNIIVLFSLSYGIGIYSISNLAYKFFTWFRLGKEFTVLAYGLTMCIFVLFLIVSVIYASYEFSENIYPEMSSKDIGVQVTMKIPYPNHYFPYFYYTYLLTFVSVYLITLLSLRTYVKRTRLVFFYIVFSIPLIYFLLNSLPFFIDYMAVLILYSSSFYGPLYALMFSGTGPIGGILFSIAIIVFSRRMDNPVVRNYLSISALGMLLFFTINQNPPLQESLLPPFEIISKSFIGLSCYLILVGIYSSIALLSRRNTLTNAVLKELSKDRLFGSVVRTEQEIQARDIIEKNLNHIEAFRGTEPKELSKDEVLELVETVKKEMSGQKKSEPE